MSRVAKTAPVEFADDPVDNVVADNVVKTARAGAHQVDADGVEHIACLIPDPEKPDEDKAFIKVWRVYHHERHGADAKGKKPAKSDVIAKRIIDILKDIAESLNLEDIVDHLSEIAKKAEIKKVLDRMVKDEKLIYDAKLYTLPDEDAEDEDIDDDA